MLRVGIVSGSPASAEGNGRCGALGTSGRDALCDGAGDGGCEDGAAD